MKSGFVPRINTALVAPSWEYLGRFFCTYGRHAPKTTSNCSNVTERVMAATRITAPITHWPAAHAVFGECDEIPLEKVGFALAFCAKLLYNEFK